MSVAISRARLLCGTGLLIAFGATGAMAQEPVESVVVTGSRLSSAFEAPTPVTVVDSTQIKQSGYVNIEDTLVATPQFRGSQGDGKFNNGQGTGGATLNLRGLGAQRNLVLVNGRRYTIQGPDQTTDVNTIPIALIQRTEIVTGGSSAVYGSDAITGVVNFIMKQDFEGVEAQSHVDFDSSTMTPAWSVDFTGGTNFANDRGNIAVSVGYLNRGGISREDRGGIYVPPLSDGCVTPASYNPRGQGIKLNGTTGQACLNAGGINGFINGGSGDIPNGRFTPTYLPGTTSTNNLPGGLGALTNAAWANAGMADATSFGYTYDNAGTNARVAMDPNDRYNLTLPNYLQIPQQRWMINSFAHYDLFPNVTAYAEMHFSTNLVVSRLSPSNVNATMLFDTNNPYISPQMQALFTQLDNDEQGTISTTEGAKTYTTVAGDGLASMNVGRRFTDVGNRISNARRDAWRFVGGFRGNLPDVSASLFHDMTYDVYYDYARTELTDHQTGSVSRSHLQDALLSVKGAAPVCNIFGQNISAACINTIGITSTNLTSAQMAGAQASVTGTAFDMPAGPVAFALGLEWRSTAAEYIPDSYLSSGDVAGFNAALPTKGSESVREIFGEVRVPLVTNVPLVQDLSVDGAFRNSSYNLSGVGSVWTYSGGINWRTDDNVSFRAQYQRAIRAPNVGELFGGQSANFSSFVDPCANVANVGNAKISALCLAQGVPQGNLFTGIVQPTPLVGNVSGGNPNLSAEASETFTLGTVLTPSFVPGLALSVDWYSIGVHGAIAQLGGGLTNTGNLCFNVIQDPNSIYCKAFNRDPNTGAIAAPQYVQVGLANTGAMKTQGVDFAGQYNWDLDWGYLSDSSVLHVDANYTWTTEFTQTPVQSLPNVTNECVGSFGSTCGSPIPALRGNSRVTWTDGPASVSMRWRYIGGSTRDQYILPLRGGKGAPNMNTLSSPTIGTFDYFDLTAGYNISDSVRIDGGINNLFNTAPPVLGSAVNGNVTYPATYDPLGQTYFMNVTLLAN